MYNALYFRDSYLLLPAGLPTWEAFCADLRSRQLPATYELIPLLENNRIRCGAELRGQCMAPCFLSDGRNEAVPVAIADASEVFPAQVERMTTAEYNARLRQVILTHCEGCAGYTPIDDSDDSLQGHHSEISLNGVCFYRWTQEGENLAFCDDLDELCTTFTSQSLARQPIGVIRAVLDAFTQSALTLVRRRRDDDGAVTLDLRWREEDPLAPALLECIRSHVHRATGGAVTLVTHTIPDLTLEALCAIMAPDSREALRESCLSHGCALADLRWQAEEHRYIYASLKRMEAQRLAHILYDGPGRAILLLLDPPSALKALRYRTPLLSPHGAVVTVHGAGSVMEYIISFDMPRRICG